MDNYFAATLEQVGMHRVVGRSVPLVDAGGWYDPSVDSGLAGFWGVKSRIHIYHPGH